MDTAGLTFTLKTEGADLGRAGVVEAFCAPGIFNQFLSARNTRARLAGMNRDSHSRARQVDPRLLRFGRHMQRVRRRADQYRRAVIDDRVKSLIRRLAAAGTCQDRKSVV